MSEMTSKTEPNVHRILVPIDFSTASHNAFEYAMHVAESLEAKLILLHVYQDVPVGVDYMPEGLVSALREEKKGKAYSLLDEYLAESQVVARKSIQAISCLRSGKPASEIVQAATELNSDMIIMGTQGANSPAEHILGSITAEVLQRASCPVLAIPAKFRYRPIERVMYALGLEANDPSVIQNLANISSSLGASLICANIQTGKAEWQDIDWTCLETLEEWEKDGKIAFSINQADEVLKGLVNFIEDQKIDLIALKMHKHPLALNQNKPILSRELLMTTEIPLLAFPEQ